MRQVRTALVVAAVLCAAAACAGSASDPSADDVGGTTTAPVPVDAFAATVVRVVDGDTVIARRSGRDLRVRLIGIDAPESVKPDSPVECYGPQASQVLHTLLPVGEQVRATYESGGRRDFYGRELWDLWTADGRFVQGELVRRGAARARLYRPQHEYADLLARLDEEARDAHAGLWQACDVDSDG